AALRTDALVEGRGFREWVAAAVRHQVLGQQHRQLLIGDGHLPARAAVDERDRAAPVALPRDAPVAQAVLHALAAETLLLERRGDRVHRALEIEARELARAHGHPVFGV